MPRHLLLLVLLAAGTLGLAALYLARRAAPEAAAPEAVPVERDDGKLAAMERQLAAQAAELKQLRVLLDEQRRKNEALRQADEALALMASSPTRNPPAAPAAAPAVTNNPFAQILQSIGTIFTNPATMKALSRGMRGSMRERDHLYDAFIAKAGLNDEEARAFRRLIHKKQMAKFGRGWMGREESDDQLRQAGDDLRTLLGPRYDAYLAYENQLPARTFVDGFAASLEDSDGKGLSAQSREDLIAAVAAIPGMSEADRAGSFEADFKPGQPVDPQKMVDRSMERTMEHYDQIVAAARPVLTPAENAALDEYLGEQVAQQEVGANIAKSILPAIFGTNGVPGFLAPGGGSTTGGVNVRVITAPGP